MRIDFMHDAARAKLPNIDIPADSDTLSRFTVKRPARDGKKFSRLSGYSDICDITLFFVYSRSPSRQPIVTTFSAHLTKMQE
ncbi:hypothetical protein HNQ60_001819 [Povalibacter uvarum]|uniref:Uncharacterized protein n=1 Tax=Povalibacter uvarum TaxID=732238 RepID=A0A841HIC4_9GAMM|nr:hypothetical protein [Povalibacter uvarum]MBB6092941.1 hypothetical protein [Povalibacter uvarum]